MTDEFRATLARDDLPSEMRQKLRCVQDVLDGDEQASLQSFFLLGDEPYAVIAFGDLDEADLVVYLLHGIDTKLDSLPQWAGFAQRLCADVIRSCVARGKPRRIATVAWFAWDSGTNTTALATKHATIGAARLAIDIDRLSLRNPDARIAVAAYSYSSTLLGELFALNFAESVHVAFSVASAGVTHAAGAALGEAIAHGALTLYATEGADDNTAPLGRLGAHPIDPRGVRGVIGYDCDGGEAPGIDGGTVIGLPVEGHASQTYIDEHGIRHPGYFDERAQGYLFLVARLADAAIAAR